MWSVTSQKCLFSNLTTRSTTISWFLFNFKNLKNRVNCSYTRGIWKASGLDKKATWLIDFDIFIFQQNPLEVQYNFSIVAPIHLIPWRRFDHSIFSPASDFSRLRKRKSNRGICMENTGDGIFNKIKCGKRVSFTRAYWFSCYLSSV